MCFDILVLVRSTFAIGEWALQHSRVTEAMFTKFYVRPGVLGTKKEVFGALLEPVSFVESFAASRNLTYQRFRIREG